MRTKTLLLTAALTALSSAAVMAQTNVYSLNAVGYINVTVLPGFNMIACQLQTGTNTLGNLIPDSTNAAGIGYIDKCVAYKFNGTSYTIDNANSATSSFANNWTSGGVMTMNPGEAIWFKNVFSTNLTFTFVARFLKERSRSRLRDQTRLTWLAPKCPKPVMLSQTWV